MSLANSFNPIAARSFVTRLLLCAVMVLSCAVVNAAEESDSIRIRIAWGGGSPVRWQGRVNVTDGAISEFSLLGRERDTAGSIWLADGAAVIAEPRPRTFDGFDITANAPLTATLRIEMQAADGTEPQIVEVPLADLMTHQHRSTIHAAGTTLLVHRAQDDSLRLHVERKDLIYSPGESLEFTVEPVIAGLEPGGSIDMSAELLRDRDGPREWTGSERVSLPPREHAKVPFKIPLPQREGVYSVRLIARTPPGNRVKFWETTGTDQLATRTFQVVVLAAEAPHHYTNADWQTVLEINPANPKWWNRLPEWARLDRLTGKLTGPMGSEAFRTTPWRGWTLAELTASHADAPAWQAYPLPSAEPGKPHVVEIDLPPDVSQQLVLRIYEHDASGKLVATGTASGVQVGESYAVEPPTATVSHRYLFWPRTKSPLLVIENASTTTKGVYGQIRLKIAREVLTAAPTRSDERLVAAYFAWDGLLERTAARESTSDGKLALDDWQTFYLAADRLAALLELSRYNGAVVNVLADGSAALSMGDYPTNPQMNTSRIATGMADLPEIDPMELMLRMFSRRGLRLVPTMRFTGVLPGVDAKVRGQQYRTLEEFPVWTDNQGRPHRTLGLDPTTLGVPHYSIAHADVVDEVRAVAKRVTDAAARHTSFAGVALELPGDSFIALPPAQFGLTGPQLAKLAKQTEANPATLDGWLKQPMSALQVPDVRKRWLSQRAEGVSKSLQALASDVEQNDSSEGLLILCGELFDSPEFATRPRLTPAESLDERYLERGVDLATLNKTPGVTIAKSSHDMTGLSLADAASGMELNQSIRSSESWSNPQASLQLQHLARVASPRGSQFGTPAATAANSLFDQLDTASVSSLIDLLYAPASGPVVIGGPHGPGALSDATRFRLLNVLAKLPAGDAESNSEVVEQSVATRVFVSGDTAMVVMINASPWPIAATATLDVEKRAAATGLTVGNEPAAAPTSYAAGRHAWQVKLAPFGVETLTFSIPQVTVSGLRVEVAPEIEKLLAARCEALERRDLKPNEMSTYSALANPSFELVDASGNVTGWEVSPGVTVGTPGLDGTRAMQLKSTVSASIASVPFRVPATGQLAVTASVKAIQLADDAELRLIVEDSTGVVPPRFVRLSAASLLGDRREEDWSICQFGVEDLPLDTKSTMRIRVELMGEGEVWVDHIQAHDLVYPLDIYPESKQQVLALVQHVKKTRKAFDARQYYDCQLQLDSYWSRFLMEYLPETKIPEPNTVAPAEPNTLPATPRMTDRMKSWFRF